MDAPSLIVWCMTSTNKCRPGPAPISAARISGPAARSNGWRARSAAMDSACRVRSPSSSAPGSSMRSIGTAAVSATICSGTPSKATMLVRSTAWRATMASIARCSARASSGPSSQIAKAMLYVGSPGAS
jgi:hypothetical protein